MSGGDGEEKTRNIRALCIPLALVAVCAAVYANTLDNPFIYDDLPYFVENENLHRLWPPTWLEIDVTERSALYGRPVTSLSLALNYALGGVEVVGYRLVNIAIHLLCALAVYALTRRLLRMDARFGAEEGDGLALAVALVWMVHPLVSECVNYAVQRSESLMALFFLLVLYCSVRSFEDESPRWAWGAVLCCALGMASKETMIGAPLVALLCDRGFAAGSFAGALRRRPWLYGGLAATWLVLARGMWAMPHGATIGVRHWTDVWIYALNQCQMLWTYLRLSFWPHPLVLDYGYPRQLTIAEVWLEGAAILALLALTAVALRRWPRWGLAGAWIFLVLAPTSSFVPILTEVGAERRMYLPLAVLTTLVLTALYSLLRRTCPGRPGMVASGLALGLTAVLAYATVERNRDYGSQVSIWYTVTAAVPDNARAHYNLGRAYMEKRLYAWALEEYAAALELWPGDADALMNTGVIHQALGDLVAAEDAYVRAVIARPTYVEAWENLGHTYREAGNIEKARVAYGELLRLAPAHPRRAAYEEWLSTE